MTPKTVIAPVKSAWASKVNWIGAIAVGATALTGFVNVFHLDATTSAHLTAGVAGVAGALTILARTFLTQSIIASSTKGMS